MKKFIFFLSKNRGFTLIELIVITGIIFTLTGIIVVNLVRQRNITSVGATIDILISDMTTQQTKSMSGNESFGVYFESDKYTLFKGASYSFNNTTNFVVDVDKNLLISNIRFPSSTIVYATRSGEVKNFSQGNNTIIIQSVSGLETKTMTVNKYGVMTGVN